jgi:hypothetical protein
MTAADGRLEAWLHAYKMAEAVKDTLRQPDRADHEGLTVVVATAQVFADLANSSDEIGEAAGDYLRRQAAELDECQRRARAAINCILNNRKESDAR